jgi:hypothetical protein
MTEILNQLSKFSLHWISEGNYPFIAFKWDATTINPEKLKQLIGCDPHAPVEIVNINDFFTPVIEEQDWHNDEEKATVKEYQNLLTVLKQLLNNIQVYRVGSSPEIDIYIVGETSERNLAGVSTKSIET